MVVSCWAMMSLLIYANGCERDMTGMLWSVIAEICTFSNVSSSSSSSSTVLLLLLLLPIEIDSKEERNAYARARKQDKVARRVCYLWPHFHTSFQHFFRSIILPCVCVSICECVRSIGILYGNSLLAYYFRPFSVSSSSERINTLKYIYGNHLTYCAGKQWPN